MKGIGERMTKDDLQMIAFQIIANSGEAMNCYVEALGMAKRKENTYQEKIKEGDCFIHKAHEAQTHLLVEESKGLDNHVTITMIHAQDHLMNVLLYKTVVLELIEIHVGR